MFRSSRKRCRSHRGDDRETGRVRRSIGAAVLALALIAPAGAAAQGEVPGGSGLDQYVESVPGAGGNHAPGTAGRGESTPRVQLPARVRSALARQRGGQALERLATDPELGAPGRARRAKKGGSSSSGDQGVASSTTSTLSGSRGGGLAVLAAVLLIAAVGTFAAVRRVRARRAVR